MKQLVSGIKVDKCVLPDHMLVCLDAFGAWQQADGALEPDNQDPDTQEPVNQEFFLEATKSLYKEFPHVRLADLLERQTGQRPVPNPAWQSGKVDFDFELPTTKQNAERVQLSQTLAEMSETQMLTICLVGKQRHHNEIHELERLHNRAATFFPNFFGPLFIITLQEESRGGISGLRETLVGSNVQILIDEDGRVHRTFGVRWSPFTFAIDRSGNILGRTSLDEVNIWQMIAKLAKKN